MTSLEIGIVVSLCMLVMVIIGMRVAFAAALAGLVGLIWIFWAKKGFDPSSFLWALGVATKTAGQVPGPPRDGQSPGLCAVGTKTQ